VHSPRKKDKQPGPTHAGSTHSRLGNPYPAGLQPVVIEFDTTLSAADTDIESAWSQSDYKPGEPQDYLYEQPEADWPRLNLYLAERGPHETDEQYALHRRDFERFTCTHAIWLGLCQQLCTHLGNHRTCSEGACRRNGACAGIRDQNRYWLPLLVYPPCVPLDREIMETYRMEIVAEIKRVVARGSDAAAGCPPGCAPAKDRLTRPETNG
jgi:hypothetical protein